MSDKAILDEAQDVFKCAVDCESENRTAMLADIRFARLGEQWSEDDKKARGKDRPCLTINKLPAFARQVVNDARQNRPAINVTPVDSQSDPETAKVLSGIIKHIERNSCADVAYDTAVDFAVYGGIGYVSVSTEYADDTGFEQEVMINRVVNPFSVYGDPDAESADGSDWKRAFQIISGDADKFRKQYKDKDLMSWNEAGTGDVTDDEKDEIRLARYWNVSDQKKTLILLSNGGAITSDQLTDDYLALLAANQIQPTEKSREIVVPKVTLYVLSGDAVLETTEWAGKYIPIIPVYGEEIWVEDKRVWKSLIRDAKDAQRAFNYWRTAATELVALQPKAPFIGPKGSFKTDAQKWATANTQNHQFLEYDPMPNQPPPQRQGFTGIPAGALQEALNASDDIKSILGMFDASLGAKSNETSGKAIMARQREGDVAQFHFMDNLVRSIRQVGKVCLDLIPKVYDTPRTMRIIGKEDDIQQVPVNQQYETVDEQGQAIIAMHDLTTGRYDVSVNAGPSFTTQRQEAAVQMGEMLRAVPAAAPVILPRMVKNLDWPGADDIAKDLEKLSPGNQGNPEQVAQAMQQAQQMSQQAQEAMGQVEQGKAEIEKGKAELEKLVAKLETKQAQIATAEAKLQAEVAQAKMDLHGREMQLDVKNYQADQRGAQLEQGAMQSGEQNAAAIVQQALEAVTQKIAGLEQAMSRQGQQPIIVPMNGGRRRSVMTRDKKTGQVFVDTDDVSDDGIGQA